MSKPIGVIGVDHNGELVINAYGDVLVFRDASDAQIAGAEKFYKLYKADARHLRKKTKPESKETK